MTGEPERCDYERSRQPFGSTVEEFYSLQNEPNDGFLHFARASL
jgi:hypothetical protein